MRKRHLLVSELIILAFLVGLGGFYLSRGSKESVIIPTGFSDVIPAEMTPAVDPGEQKQEIQVTQAKVDRPIEEEFAEAGEDLGAVYYVSRIREAIREGNPSFARELLRQMKEQHPDSVLLEEAESLCKNQPEKTVGRS